MRPGPSAAVAAGLSTIFFACTMPEPETADDVFGDALETRMIAAAAEPPMARVAPTELEMHGDVRVDDYYWLRERENPEVIQYLTAENDYLDQVMAPTRELQETLYNEIVGRIQEIDESAQYRDGDYDYYYRYAEDGEYPIYCRSQALPEAPEEVMLDGNLLAEGHEFFSLRGRQISTGQDLVAYGVDTVGRRFYDMRFRDLTTGEDLADEIPDVTGNGVWANDNQTFFYVKQHPETLRWFQVFRHVLGTEANEDELIYEEADEEYGVFLYRSKSDRFIFLASTHTLASEIRVLDADRPEDSFQVFEPRQIDHEYQVDHAGDHFYIRTNWDATNFRLMKTGLDATAREHWSEVIAHRDDVLLENVELFSGHLVVAERRGGLVQMRVIPWEGDGEHDLDFGEPAYSARFDNNHDLDTTILRFRYTSLTTPSSIYHYDMATREKTLVKEDPVLGGFDRNDYQSERLMVPARDGALVPVSIVYRKGLTRDGSHPLLLYAYGSYGASMDASFRSYRLSLLDRGVAFAIAHIRGGQEMGRSWYEDGKLLKKMNTFTDFVDVGRHLVAEGYTREDRLIAEGGSAGGLLMGAVTNLAPELFQGVISHVAFVDVVTTMLDSDIPLTTSEYDEWGDPNEQEFYDYMLSYSPYDNLQARDYPNVLLTTGLHDSQVQYWEPAKYAARMRALKTDDKVLLLKTNMEAGHGGATGRFKQHRETALSYAFLLDLVGIRK